MPAAPLVTPGRCLWCWYPMDGRANEAKGEGAIRPQPVPAVRSMLAGQARRQAGPFRLPWAALQMNRRVGSTALRHRPHVGRQPPFIEPEVNQRRDRAWHAEGAAV